MLQDNALYRDGARVDVGCDADDLAGVRDRAREGDFTWVGLWEPTTEELAEVERVYDLPSFAVEDALKAHQRPKLEAYEGLQFMVLKTLWYFDERDAVETGEIALFIGADFVVTVRHGEGNPLHDARRRIDQRLRTDARGPSAVVYVVADSVVDGYEAVATELTVDVDEVEAAVFSEERTNDSRRIYTLKREILECRRAVMPLREPIGRLAGGRVQGIDPASSQGFRDVADHVDRVAEIIDSLDDLLSTAFNAHLAMIGVQQNDDMRRLSAAVALVAGPTLIGAVYGMNFTNMPELDWTYGYPYALGLMAVTSLVLLFFFKRSGWF
ncbi:magnesium and cobalt transport protein CorA [Nocardioidaceae bacterium]|nr:magnesium and cobalt transport protein CorA [Nocardioidaceae bacterium]